MRWLALLVLVGCTSENPGDDTWPWNDDTGGDDTGDTSDTGSPWTVERIEDRSASLQAAIAVANGHVFVAYFDDDAWQDGTCDEVPISPPPRMRQGIRLAEYDGTDWTVQSVDDPVVAFEPTGLDLGIDGSGQPVIAYTGGDPSGQYCGANDAVVATRTGGGWTMQTAAAESNDAATGEPASDAGFVVGLWPALAFDADGDPAVVYKDVHFGAQQGDDRFRADAELAWRDGGGWTHEVIDAGEGAGEPNRLVFDDAGRPVAIYAIPFSAQGESRLGVWASRRDPDSGDWERVQLHDGTIHPVIAAGVHPVSGALVVAFYADDEQAVRVRTLDPADDFTVASEWTDTVVAAPGFDEGRYPSLAFSPDGNPLLAYHRCKRAGASGSCDANDEALVFAEQHGTSWTYQVVHQDPPGSCGRYPALAVDTAGTAWIAFRCTEEVEGDFRQRPYIARRPL